MPEKLTDIEKEHVMRVLGEACGGTPLAPQAEFVAGYLGTHVISLLENWETVKRQLREYKAPAAGTTIHSDVKRRRIIKP